MLGPDEVATRDEWVAGLGTVGASGDERGRKLVARGEVRAHAVLDGGGVAPGAVVVAVKTMDRACVGAALVG